MVFFLENVIFGRNKSACGKPPVGGKWFWSFFAEKKAPAASRQLEGNGLFPRETLFWAKKGACGKPPVGGEKNRQNFHFFFFSIFPPDLGDEFGYNRLSF